MIMVVFGDGADRDGVRTACRDLESTEQSLLLDMVTRWFEDGRSRWKDIEFGYHFYMICEEHAPGRKKKKEN